VDQEGIRYTNVDQEGISATCVNTPHVIADLEEGCFDYSEEEEEGSFDESEEEGEENKE
ncbi:hypothetical protein KIPB_010430, partial [Kipferlia bialata]